MSFIPVLQYILGIGVFGFIYWFLDGVLDEFIGTGIYVAGNIWDFLTYVWIGILIIYLVFGGIWLVRKYNEQEYSGGM